MAYPQHFNTFVQLGTLFNEFCESDTVKNEGWSSKLEAVLADAELQNKWYTQENLRHALKEWSKVLTQPSLEEWLIPYALVPPKNPKTIGLVMAGNIPLVGFHDLLCILLSGNFVLAKLSSNDRVLLPFIKTYLQEIDPELGEKITFTEDRLDNFDAAIATGSNNTSRYFEYYFNKYPNIIRKNRNSVAVITGQETPDELKRLGTDIFQYFGLGCRSISKLYVPENYDFKTFFTAIFDWKHLLEHHKYVNNYDYNKAVYLMSEMSILDNGFLILKEDTAFASPIATLFYERYSDAVKLKEELKKSSHALQCIVSNGFMDGEIQFGQTQSPKLSDYADGVDTLAFLKQLTLE